MLQQHAPCRSPHHIPCSARWLEIAGIKIPREDGAPAAKIEISPLSALGPEDLPTEDTPKTIEPGAEIVI